MEHIVPGTHIVILGPPGSGKGTQAERVAGELGLRHLSTGDVLREGVARKTTLGLEAEDYMNRGLLVPDEIMLGLIREELDNLGDTGWILDGFPRTVAQADALSAMLGERGQAIDHVVLVDVEPEVIVERLSSRRVCPECSTVYNLAALKGGDAETCGKCGAELVKRPDDEEETVRRRLEVYRRQTSPVIEFYRSQDGIITIDGAGDIEEITAEILRALR
jgi:adenylate kinase